jgi:hypothetical protein
MTTLATIEDDIKQFVEFSAEMAKHNAGLAGLALDGLAAIAAITKTAADDTAVEALRGIVAVIEAVGNGLSGRITPDEANKALAKLRPALASNDAKADAALAARFDDGPG